MTKLDCDVTNCAYNEEHKCKKESIEVGGENAKVESETTCNSFVPRGCGCSNSNCGCASEETRVTCCAKECTYNDCECCEAGHISIGGGHADRCDETECTSFKHQ